MRAWFAGEGEIPRAMFYKAIGYVVWKLALSQLRRRFARPAKVALALGVVSLIGAGYLATRSDDS